MKVIFLGTNGWYDTETGNTISTLIQTEQYAIILDAGNGLHRVERYLDGPKPTFLFLSHFHVDHIEGLHILAKFRFEKGLVICGPTGCRDILGTFLNQPFTIPLADLPYPVRIMEIPEEAASLPFSLEALPLRHSSFTLGYRFAVDGRIWRGDLVEAAANFFAALRTLDEAGVETIAVMPIPDHGLGEAINDRLKRARIAVTLTASADLP